MKKLLTLFCACLLLGTLVATPVLAATLAQDTYHNDHRTTPKLQFEPQWAAPGGLTRDGVPEAFLELEGARYQLSSEREDLRLLEVKDSLLGSHYAYQQLIHGVPVEGGMIVVSVSSKDNRIYRVYNNTFPVDLKPAAPVGVIGEERAYDSAWQELRGHGNVLAEPLSRLVYMPIGDSFVLQYIVDLQLDAPYGAWHLNIDARDGVVLQIEDSRLIRKINPDTPTIAERLAEYSGAAGDRRAAFDRYQAPPQNFDKDSRAQGTGVTFDPDPRTTLMNNSLQDNSSPSLFTDAYFTRDLLDITFSGGVYRLIGPWVHIYNWDPPSTVPSVSATGDWTATRGDNSFNDAMTYFHLDQNQRYMQNLGFTGAYAIQDGSIVTDTDGVNGADNSYYVPSTNRLSFGHGCVDDDEDADVILHEYGHAIQHDISYWAGGDTGAMGEGFGDYWAGSYSYSTPNGPDFYPNWVYTWDGHGSPTLCWPGRIMNAFGALYVHTTYYAAHVGIPGGYVSDELWSTPLFQTLLAMTDLGYPREDIDQIILEAHFGIGTGPKMRDMANAIIATAEELQPGLPHADVFIEKFLVHNIVDVPIVQLQAVEVTITGGAGSNGVADPGETFDFTVEVANDGQLGAGGVTAVLGSANPLVEVVNGSSSYADIPAGGGAINATDFTVTLDETFPCGDRAEFSLTFSFNNGKSINVVEFSMGTGMPLGLAESIEPNVPIPDNNSAGVLSEIVISGTGAEVTENISVDVRIIHPNIGDLRVYLISPVGSTMWLHNRTGTTTDNIIGNYPLTLTPVSPLNQLAGQPLDGTWTLKVSDYAAGNVGTIESWGLNDVNGYDCEDVVTPVGDELTPVRFSMWQNHPNPFNPMTTINFAVPEDAGVVSLDIYDVSGRLVRTLENGHLTSGHYSRVWDGRDTAGRQVSSGAYFYRLSGRGFSEARKMILMK